jgi:hypothetical protein
MRVMESANYRFGKLDMARTWRRCEGRNSEA